MSYPRKKRKTVEELIEKKDQVESLKNAILSIYMSQSEKDLQALVGKELPHLCQVDSIELSSQKSNIKKTKYMYSYPFTYIDKNYSIHFYKADGLTKKEKWFLQKIGQALESTLVRIEQHKQLNMDKGQWELAFDTIATPICLTDLQGNILRTNKMFREKTKVSKKDLLQKNYFNVFFGRVDNTNNLNPEDFVCSPSEEALASESNIPIRVENLGVKDLATKKRPGSPGKIIPAGYKKLPQNSNQNSINHKNKRREKHIVNGKEKIMEITIQKVPQNTETEIQLVILRDITEEIKMENKIAQSAQSAELGIISSSIAHELNNPIAGIQTLLQTLQMENKDSNIANDLKEMSAAIQRCHHIIHQLLNIHR